MTITSFILAIGLSIAILRFAYYIGANNDKKIIAIIIGIALCICVFLGFRWYHTHIASGIRELTDERSNLSNGLDRIINIYTADGNKIAHYEGKIDIEMDKNYIKFDWMGKRYIYYNCFVETIAALP